MPDSFDPYRVWLGIPAGSRPPTHYQLLGIAPTERDPSVIESAVLRQSGYVRNFQIGKHGKEAARVLTEIAAAKACLQDSVKRAKYDAELNNAQIVAQPALPVPARATKVSAVGVMLPLDIDLDRLGVPLTPLEARPLARRPAAPLRRIQATAPTSKRRAVAWYRVAGGATLAVGLALMFVAFLTRRPAEELITPDVPVILRAPNDTAAPSPEKNLPPSIEIAVDPEAPEAGGSLDVRLTARDPENDAVEIAYRTDASGAWLLANGGRMTLHDLKEGPLVLEARARDSGGHESAVIAQTVSVRPRSRVEIAIAPGTELRMMRIPGTSTRPVLPVNVPRNDNDVPIADFYLSATETTRQQWRAVLGSLPPLNNGDQRLPVVNVSRSQVARFIEALNRRQSPNGWQFRLPTTCEWFHAYLANRSHADHAAQLNTIAWNSSNAAAGLQPVAMLRANAFGLFDMLGNAWEFTTDNDRIYGGSYDQPPHHQVDYGIASEVPRDVLAPNVGFRLAASPPGAGPPESQHASLQAPVILQTKKKTYDDPQGLNFASCDGQAFSVSIGQMFGFGMVGYEIEGIARVTLKTAIRGTPRAYDENSFSGFIADYHTPAGYAHRVALSLGLSSPTRGDVVPSWGKSNVPDRFVDLPPGAAHQLALADWAPAEWDGRVWLSVLIQNSGANTGIVGRIVELIGR
jgi:hypothetical protein